MWAGLCCEPACGCEPLGGRKRHLPAHQLPKTLLSKK